MAIVQPSSGEAPQIPDGLYTLKILSATQGMRDNYEDKSILEPFLRVQVQVADTEDEEGKEIVLRTDMTLKWSAGGKFPASTLYLYANAFGVSPGPDMPFDTDLLVNRVAQGMVKTPPEGGWPAVVRDSLMPVKAVKGQPQPIDFSKMSLPQSQKAQEAPSEATPFDTAPLGDDLDLIQDEAKKIGYSMKEIIDVAQSEFGKKPADLDAAERDRFRIALGV